MSEKHKLSKVIGSPGTGKTFYILGLIEAAAKKYSADRIGAVSYTLAAVNEMKARVSASANISHDAVKNIRTLHSHCFRLMGYNKQQVVEGRDKIREWNAENPDLALPVDLKLENIEDPGGLEGGEDRQRIDILKENLKNHTRMNLARNMMKPMDSLPDATYEFYKKWSKWLFQNDYVDFTRMLEDTLESGKCPDIDVLFVDEAQDTNTLQMKILENWTERVGSSMFVGDSSQCIFKFAGSVPENFKDLPATWLKVLEQSYRVPKKVLEYANLILEQHCSDREISEYNPRKDKDGHTAEGEVIWDTVEPDLSLEGNHMILVRCNYQLATWRDYLIKHGVLWHNPYRPENPIMNPSNSGLWKAAKTYIMLKEGDIVPMGDVIKMIEYMEVNGNIAKGVKTKLKRSDESLFYNWMENVDYRNIGKIGFFTEEFCTLRKPIIEVFNLKGQAGELITRFGDMPSFYLEKPRVTLGTIHSVKGGEASNVWIDLRTSWRGHMMWHSGEINAKNDEARVAYVAVTRAKERVGLLSGIKARDEYRNRAFDVVH